MDIFERRFKQQYTIDDTQRINCIIETAQEVNGHTVINTICISLMSRIHTTDECVCVCVLNVHICIPQNPMTHTKVCPAITKYHHTSSH